MRSQCSLIRGITFELARPAIVSERNKNSLIIVLSTYRARNLVILLWLVSSRAWRGTQIVLIYWVSFVLVMLAFPVRGGFLMMTPVGLGLPIVVFLLICLHFFVYAWIKKQTKKRINDISLTSSSLQHGGKHKPTSVACTHLKRHYNLVAVSILKSSLDEPSSFLFMTTYVELTNVQQSLSRCTKQRSKPG